MFRTISKYVLGSAILILVAYNSVYFKRLDQVKMPPKNFDAKSYARNYFNEKLRPALNNSIEINQLLTLLQQDKETAFNNYSNALGIGNIRFFLLKGSGEVVAVNDNDVTITSKTDTAQYVYKIATEFIYGNAIRDASGLVSINDFTNTTDLNTVSEEINRIVRNEVLPPFKKSIKKGDKIQFSGAIELNREHMNLDNLEIIPISLEW